MSVSAPFFEIYCKPESIVMSEFTTSDCVTVDVTMVFLCPFLGEKKEAYNDEKRNFERTDQHREIGRAHV